MAAVVAKLLLKNVADYDYSDSSPVLVEGKDGYDKVKELSRGQKIDKDTYLKAVDSLVKSEEHKEILKQLTPQTYVGIASDLAKEE